MPLSVANEALYCLFLKTQTWFIKLLMLQRSKESIMGKKKATTGNSGSKTKNTAKATDSKKSSGDGDFEKLLEKVDKPKEEAVSKKKKVDKKVEKEVKKETSTKAKAKAAKSSSDADDEDDDEDAGNFSFVSMFLAIIALVLAVKILLNYNDLSSRNRVLQDRVESIDDALDRNNTSIEEKLAAFEKKLAKKPAKKAKDNRIKGLTLKLAASEKKLADATRKLDHLEKIVYTSNNFQAALDLKRTLDRLEDLSTWLTGPSKKKVDDVRAKVIDLITSLEYGSDKWQPSATFVPYKKSNKTRLPIKVKKAPKAVSKKKTSKPVTKKRLFKPAKAVPVTIKPKKGHSASKHVVKKKVTPARPTRKVKNVKPVVRPAGSKNAHMFPPVGVKKAPVKAAPAKKHAHDKKVDKHKKAPAKKNALDELFSSKAPSKDNSFESLFDDYSKKQGKSDNDMLNF